MRTTTAKKKELYNIYRYVWIGIYNDVKRKIKDLTNELDDEQ